MRSSDAISALLPTEWVTLDRFSDFWQHAGEDLEAKILFVSKSVGASLDHADLVVDPFDEPQGHLVLFMAIRRDPIPMSLDHPGELLVRLEPLPPQGRPPSVEESPRPPLPLVVPKLAEHLLEQVAPQQNLWVCFGSGSRPRLCNRANFATSAVRKPYDFLVTSF